MMSTHKHLHFGNQADAYLEWARHTCFTHFGGVLSNKQDKHVALLVQWTSEGLNAEKRKILAEFAHMADVYTERSVASITIKEHNIGRLFASSLGVRYVELATPVTGESSVEFRDINNLIGESDAPPVLLGCIDDAFPIASQRFLKKGEKNGGRRIIRFWNQEIDPTPQGKKLAMVMGDPYRTNFGYGRELIPPKLSGADRMESVQSQSDAAPLSLASDPTDSWVTMKSNTGLRHWELPGAGEAQDDTRYYQQAGLRGSLHRATHGAHVLDIFAGQLPARARKSTNRNHVNKGDGSATAPATRTGDNLSTAATATAPIVLVQLPKYAVDDPSGRWLGHNVLDGLHYILEVAKLWDKKDPEAKSTVKKIVINLSWGPQTGPHDGESLLELAIDDVIMTEQKKRGCTVEVVVPAGNSYEARAHAEFKACCGTKGICWCVPPGSSNPAFLEVWWPANTKPDTAKLTVTAPDGTRLASEGSGIWSAGVTGHGAQIRWGITQVNREGNMMSLIALAPTYNHVGSDATAPHGEWKIEVDAVSGNENLVHIYIARADHNMGARRRARPSYLRDDAYEAMRRNRATAEIDPVPCSLVQRHGTLNGLGTTNSVGMAAGYRLSDGQPAPYSSSGPSRGGRNGPDCAYPTEVSSMVHGMPAAGTRAGTVVNLVGTSSAAPQYARDEANTTFKQIKPPPPQPMNYPRIGQGRR